MGVKLGIISKEEARLKVFDKRVMRKIIGQKSNEIAASREKFITNDVYTSQNGKVKKNEMSRTCDKHWEKRNVCKIFVGKS
jgi:hypothetical protein